MSSEFPQEFSGQRATNSIDRGGDCKNAAAPRSHTDAALADTKGRQEPRSQNGVSTMIRGKLTLHDFKYLVGLFVTMAPPGEIGTCIARLSTGRSAPADALLAGNVEFSCEGFVLTVQDLRLAHNGSYCVRLQLRQRASLLDRVFDKFNRALVDALRDTCLSHVESVEFTRLERNPDEGMWEADHATPVEVLCPSESVTSQWRYELGYVPLAIYTERHSRYRFIVFSFNANCYERVSPARVRLRPDWAKWKDAVNQAIKEGARRILEGQ